MAYYARGRTHHPLRLGHEWTGTVVAVGSASEGLWLDRRVIGDTMLGCGACPDCRGGRQHVCADRREVGVTDGWPGMLAEYALIPTRFAHYVPDAVSTTAAALVEPGANALRAVRAAVSTTESTADPGRRHHRSAGDPVRGRCGRRGHGLRSATRPPRAGRSARRRAHRGRLGPGRDDRRDVRRRAGRHVGPDSTGHRAVPGPAGGRLALIGLSGEPSLIDTRDLVLADVTAVGILSASPALADTLRAYAGGLDPTPIVGETVGLDEVPARLSGHGGVGPGPKTLVDPHR